MSTTSVVKFHLTFLYYLCLFLDQFCLTFVNIIHLFVKNAVLALLTPQLYIYLSSVSLIPSVTFLPIGLF